MIHIQRLTKSLKQATFAFTERSIHRGKTIHIDNIHIDSVQVKLYNQSFDVIVTIDGWRNSYHFSRISGKIVLSDNERLKCIFGG